MRRQVVGLLIGSILTGVGAAQAQAQSLRSFHRDPYAYGVLDRFAELEGLDESVRLSGGTLPVRRHLEEVERGSGVWFQVEGPERECDAGPIDGSTLGEVLYGLGRACNLFYEVRSPHQVFVYVPEAGGFGLGNSEVIDVAQVYPERARELEVEGSVVFRVLVSPKGVVRAVEIIREVPVGYGFARAAEPVVRNYGFEPRERDGEPIETTFTVFADFTQYELRRLQRQ